MRRQEIAACPWCGRARVVNPTRGVADACPSCRHFAKSEPPGTWITNAACRGVDPELFWPDNRETAKVQAARDVCHSCPVMQNCLDYALTCNITDGIWGGLDPYERRQLTRAS